MKLYQDSGYINIRGVLDYELPFNFIVGGRATGKTYTSLLTCIENKTPFMYMRRTQSQCDLINKPEFSPFKTINNDHNLKIGTETLSKNSAGFYYQEEQDGKMVSIGAPVGFTCALSTLSNMRGFDASNVEVLIYDEFIPETHERTLKNEGMAFLNAYETINRNRELIGKKPLQVLCLANANDLGNAIFMELKLIRKAEKMRSKHAEISIDKKRGIGLFLLDKSPISEQKKQTALYRLTIGSEFERMSINNRFAGDDEKHKPLPLIEFKPVVSIGEICFYQHKSNRRYYVSTHVSGSPEIFGISDIERDRFKRQYGFLWLEYLNKNIDFEEKLCEIMLTTVFN